MFHIGNCGGPCEKHQNKEQYNSKWKGGRLLSNGYWRIRVPDHPKADIHGYYPEHRVVFEVFNKCCLLSWVDIHHINGVTVDNRIENLQPLFKKNHVSHHNPKMDMSDRRCDECGKITKNDWFKKGKKLICYNCYLREWRKNRKKLVTASYSSSTGNTKLTTSST